MSKTNPLIVGITNREDQLTLIYALTKKMLLLAEQLQWESVSKLESERSHLIYTFFETKPSVEEAERIASTILDVIAIDKDIMALSTAEQQKIMKSSKKISRGKQASKAYAMSK